MLRPRVLILILTMQAKGSAKERNFIVFDVVKPGHYAVGCSMELCEICLKPKHEAECRFYQLRNRWLPYTGFVIPSSCFLRLRR